MHILYSLVDSLMRPLTLRGADNQQKRTVMQLLAASGVVRRGHVELRYPTLRRRHSPPRTASWNRTPTDIKT
jgi:hypothetical protein